MPLPQPMLAYFNILPDPQEQTSVKYKSKHNDYHSRKCMWKCRLQNGSHFVLGSMESPIGCLQSDGHFLISICTHIYIHIKIIHISLTRCYCLYTVPFFLGFRQGRLLGPIEVDRCRWDDPAGDLLISWRLLHDWLRDIVDRRLKKSEDNLGWVSTNENNSESAMYE